MAEYDYLENDKKLFEIAELIDNDFFLESIKEQIDNGLDSSNTDYLAKLHIKMEQVQEKYQEEDYGEIIKFINELSEKIIQWVEDKYGIEISYDSDDLEKAADQVYKLFVIELKDILSAGITAYVIENYISLIDSIGLDNLKTSFLPSNVEDDEKYKLLVAGNIGILVDTVADIGMDFDEFLSYASRYGDIDCISDLQNGNHPITLEDGEGVFNTLMKSIHDSEYDHNILLDIYENIIGQFDITKKEVSIYGENFDIEYPDPIEE